MTLDLGQAAAAHGWQAPFATLKASRWSTDTRRMEAGSVFIALRGPNYDGHNYVAEAFQKGAIAAIVDRDAPACQGPVVRTPDSLRALQQLASWARSQWSGDLVAVTGSAGKTTTKEAIARLVSVRKVTGRSEGNFNNHIGVPLSILELPDAAEAAVVEIGMNHAGEIRALAAIARPSVGVVTNVGWAHVENFPSVEGVALAKRELIESLDGDGVAVLNADDEKVARFADIHSGPVVTFGIDHPADIRATEVEFLPGGARFQAAGAAFEIPLPGRHGVMNVLAAIAVAYGVFGIPAEELVPAARLLAPGKMRGERLVVNGITIWNDCYNSNPDAARAMIRVLRDTPARRRIAVLGEMLELGRWTETLHRAVGRYAAECGIDSLVGIRGAARLMVEEAVEAGLPAGAAYFFEDPEEAGEFLRRSLASGDAVLFKGSRGTRVEKALERLLA
jgi:UDP-N-acetylmuramoyl-tripeptide--D-alanyl-D-alanine ligase